jgi:Tfp pilus assembly protein PilO
VNEKKVTIITIVCLAFILLAGGGAIYYLQFVILAEKEVALAAVAQSLREAQEKVAKIPVLEKEIKDMEVTEKELEKRIPKLTRAEYDTFANLLDDFRRRSGVSVSRGSWVLPQKPQPTPGRPQPRNIPASVHKVEYDIAVTGGFYQLLRYMNLLEQENRFINVESFTIARPGEGAKREMKLTLYSYTYRPPTETPEVEIVEQRKGRSTDIPD